ncbi:MAG: efflux transporter periplasmic adaptor subunit [Proteobacteria bacterium]|nr:MAG: efflux transporter periplasmic adaptor subunit [Pseudomonadota bacterium]
MKSRTNPVKESISPFGQPTGGTIGRASSVWKWLVNFVVCLAIVGIGYLIYVHLINTAPKVRQRLPAKTPPRIEAMTLHPVDHRVLIDAMGSVVPAREMVLKSRVSGQVAAIDGEFTAGGIVSQGALLVKIDPQDYQLALARKESQLANAEYELKLEMGHQAVARKEWALLYEGRPLPSEDEELALRKPHLAKVRADMAAARSELEQARIDLARTEIKAPFNALIRDVHVEVGSQISPQDALAEIVGIDHYWIRVALPVDRLGWFDIPSVRSDPHDVGAAVSVSYRGHRCSGQVVRLLGDLDNQGRMARILVAVRDPLGLNSKKPEGPPLLIGEYVRVEIEGRLLTGVYKIPRSSLRDNDTIWLAEADDTLRIEPVEILWRDNHVVLICNHLQPGDRLVLSDLATPVSGMALEVLAQRTGPEGEGRIDG